MTHEEEIRALNEKAQELAQLTGNLEAKLKALPSEEETAPMRNMLERMIGELRRMEKNLLAMARISAGSEAEGGAENGNY